MNICMVSRMLPTHSGSGGAEDHTLELSKGLANNDNKVWIITTKHPTKKYEKIYGLEIFYLEDTDTGRYNKKWWTNSLKKAKELHKKYQLDIVHSQINAGKSLIKFCKNNSIAFFNSMHGVVYDDIKTKFNLGLTYNPIRKFMGFLWCFFYWWPFLYISREFPVNHGADCVIATSNEQYKIMNKIYLLKKQNIKKIFNGIDNRIFFPIKDKEKIKREYNIGKDEKILLCVARLEEEKGIQFAVLALKKLITKNYNVKLFVLGHGPFLDKLKRLAIGYEKNILFTGRVPFSKLHIFFNGCDIFINPTIRQNGYDLTMAEAMACESIVISSDIGSTRTIIKDGEDGILFKKKNINDLTKKIELILNTPTLANEIRKHAREKILGDFTLELMVKKTIQAYRSVLDRVRDKKA